MNEYDSNRIFDLVAKIDFQKTDIQNEADCFLLNTCHIREKATEEHHDHLIDIILVKLQNLLMKI